MSVAAPALPSDGLRHDGRDGVRATLRLLGAADRIAKLCQQRFRDLGATLPRFDVMAALDAAGEPLTMGALSDRLLVSNGAVTPVVVSLVEAGLVRQQTKAGDRRTRLVSLTPQGTTQFATLAQAHRGWMSHAFAVLTQDELAALIRTLARLSATLDADVSRTPAWEGADVSDPA